MTDFRAPPAEDPYLESMKAAREASAVLKLRLAAIRADLPSVPIFAVEGDDDKLVYFQWISQVRRGFDHDYLVCKNKRGVLQLSQSLLRDRTELNKNVYFFVDRDFDDLSGFEETPALFMTDRYSVENYLVTPDVLDAILKVEFHCNLRPALRTSICDTYRGALDRFLEVTRELNRRIFVAKKIGIGFRKPLPDKIGPLAVVELRAVEGLDTKSSEVVLLKREPTSEEWALWSPQFDALPALERYRGKFALAFFKRWLVKLHEEYVSENADSIFKDLDRRSNARVQELVVSNFASRSRLPAGFCDFAMTWA